MFWVDIWAAIGWFRGGFGVVFGGECGVVRGAALGCEFVL